MTLNTFHFAGHGAANVTLGIPRLREIVMTASQHIRTPTMQLPIIESVTNTELAAFCQTSTRLTLSQIVDEVIVTEKLSSKTSDNGYSRQKLYTIRLAFYPREDYVSEYNITAEQILTGIARTFVPLLDKNIRKGRRQIEKQMQEEAGQVGSTKTVTEGAANRAVAAEADALEAEEAGVGRDNGEEEDGDADDMRRHAQKDQGQTYESDEEVDADVDEAGMEAAFADQESDADGSDVEAEELDPVAAAKASRAESIAKMKVVEKSIPRGSFYVQSVRFDKEGGQYCEFDLEVSLSLLVLSFHSFEILPSLLLPITSCCLSVSPRSAVELRSSTRFLESLDVSSANLRRRMLLPRFVSLLLFLLRAVADPRYNSVWR